MSTWDTDSNYETETAHHRIGAGGRHPVNVGHLVMGLAFAGMVVLWALISQDLVGAGDLRWLLPLPWVVGGGAGLVAMALGTRRRQAAQDAQAPAAQDA